MHECNKKISFYHIIGSTHIQLKDKCVISMTSIGKGMKCLIGYKDIINDKMSGNKGTLLWRNDGRQNQFKFIS